MRSGSIGNRPVRNATRPRLLPCHPDLESSGADVLSERLRIDHVTREVYVAGDCKKPFIVFQLDPAEFPDELRYLCLVFNTFQLTT